MLRAVLQFVPWGHDGLSLDLMRRDRNAQAGLNDFLIVESIKAAPGLGVKRLSLNFAMFRAALERGEKIGAGPVLKAWRNLLVFLSRWFQIESLYKFNAKFSPTWEPRFFVYPGGRDAPRIAFAALEAEAFLVWPTFEVKRYARRVGRRLGLHKVRRRYRARRSRATGRPALPVRTGGRAGRGPDYTIPVMVNLPGLAGTPPAGRCLVMGVVNVTPDSFSDGGRWFGAGEAIEHGLRMVAEGADIVDVGGESTRPGAQRVPADEELRRVKPVITELVAAGVVVSVDTMRAQVAEWALEAGVSLVNDVSGGLADPYMPRLVAKAGVPYVVVHWRGHSHDMYSRAVYADVVREVHDELAQRVGAVIAEGVDPSMIVLDPGLGFSKNPAPVGPEAHNWQLVAGLPELARIGGRDFPVLVGASRKRYLSRLFDEAGGEQRPYTENDAATVAITALSAAAGAWCVRVHQVPANADAVRVAAAYRAAPLMTAVVLALGSNLGDRQDILQGAVDAIVGLPGVRVTAVSPVYETVPGRRPGPARLPQRRRPRGRRPAGPRPA